MKMLERTPAKYDRGMRLITLGRIDRLKKLIASQWIEPGHTVLEIGCGTGTLAAMMATRGASVLGIDLSNAMLTEAQKNAPDCEFQHLSAVEIEKLGHARFDRVVATLSLSELTEDELAVVLRDVAKVLRPQGRLVIADEVEPEKLAARLLTRVFRLPWAAVTFLITQSTTRALVGIKPRLEASGFRVLNEDHYLAGTLALIVAEKI
ncbi:MAG: corrinoid protein-associated methyltransferase CpaM [Phycisphaeraceae bacterium]